MFFTRLAVAALSLGSAVKVFGAPIAIEVAVPPAAAAAVDIGSLERRVDLTFIGAVGVAQGVVDTAKAGVQIIVNTVNNVMATNTGLDSVLAPIAPALNQMTAVLQAPGFSIDSLLAGASTVEAAGDKLAAVLKTLSGAMDAIKTDPAASGLKDVIQEIDTSLKTLDDALKVVPELRAIVNGLLASVLELVQELLANILGGLTGSLGLLAGISPA
ncbi:hypothetical protein RhiJN_15312 [Ceratobasidium sp. AG-Ba]|nr:hypothetical protein RhiJN_15312 [Ceratobasidium sp. AG-Ba]